MFWIRTVITLSWMVVIVIVVLPVPVEAEPDWVKSAIEVAGTRKPHEDAAIWVLHNSVDVRISKSGRTKSHVRRAIKLLRSSGEDLCMLREATADWRTMQRVKGWLVSPDGKTKKLKKEN